MSEVRAHLGPYYSDVGRPSIDPELMIRMLIVGYGFGIRSERRLCEEVHLNLAYRWFCRLGLDADVPIKELLRPTIVDRRGDALAAAELGYALLSEPQVRREAVDRLDELLRRIAPSVDDCLCHTIDPTRYLMAGQPFRSG